MNTNWIAVWGCPIARPSRTVAQWMHDTTVRMNMFMTVEGTALRFHFSNLFGENSATIAAATVALSVGGGSVDENTVTAITFGGDTSVTMSAHGDVSSDEMPFKFKVGDTIAVSLYFKDFTQMTTAHANNGDFIEKWVSSGDQTRSAKLPVNDTANADAYPFIHTVDALCADDCYSIVAFGDSITAQSWPDRLARRIHQLGITNVAIVRKAISGSRVLREYPCTLYTNYGPKGLDRFEREVLRAGVKKVFILHGINDIIHPCGSPFRPLSDQPTADELAEGLKFYVDTAHANGIEAYVSTILPFGGWRTYCDEKDAVRIGVNNWICKNADINGVLPFESAVSDLQKPLCLKAEFDSGDHLHPSGAGAQAMADSVPEELI